MKEKVIWKEITKDDGRRVKIPFRTCEKCEKEFSNGNTFASKYCPECAAEIKKEKTRERVRKYRENVEKSAK